MASVPDAGPLVPPVVAIAASLGGLAALTRVLADLPEHFPAAVLVLQHLEQGRRSQLAEILDDRVRLPVEEASDGRRLEAGRVYVAPPGRHLLLDAAGAVAFARTPRLHHVRPSADELFRSVAACCGERAVAVVLTGRGRDGSGGVVAIQAGGGTVIAQDRESSESFDMPEASIATGAVSRVLPLDRIAEALIHLVQEHAGA